jgi:hypothetical protein
LPVANIPSEIECSRNVAFEVIDDSHRSLYFTTNIWG